MSFEFHINGNQTTLFILFVLRSCTFGFADYTGVSQASSGYPNFPPEAMMELGAVTFIPYSA